MRRPRRLSMQEWIWVREAISQLCSCHSVSDQDEDYRSVAWTAFFIAFRRFHPISSPNFWPYAYRKINAALVREKRERQDRVYRMLSLNIPAAPDSEETLLDRLPARHGDFTNSVSFWDFLDRLPQGLSQLAVLLVNGYDLEEARSILGQSDQELCQNVYQLQEALTRYRTI